MDKIADDMLFGTADDEPRYRGLLQAMVDAGVCRRTAPSATERCGARRPPFSAASDAAAEARGGRSRRPRRRSARALGLGEAAAPAAPTRCARRSSRGGGGQAGFDALAAVSSRRRGIGADRQGSPRPRRAASIGRPCASGGERRRRDDRPARSACGSGELASARSATGGSGDRASRFDAGGRVERQLEFFRRRAHHTSLARGAGAVRQVDTAVVARGASSAWARMG